MCTYWLIFSCFFPHFHPPAPLTSSRTFRSGWIWSWRRAAFSTSWAATDSSRSRTTFSCWRFYRVSTPSFNWTDCFMCQSLRRLSALWSIICVQMELLLFLRLQTEFLIFSSLVPRVRNAKSPTAMTSINVYETRLASTWSFVRSPPKSLRLKTWISNEFSKESIFYSFQSVFQVSRNTKIYEVHFFSFHIATTNFTTSIHNFHLKFVFFSRVNASFIRFLNLGTFCWHRTVPHQISEEFSEKVIFFRAWQLNFDKVDKIKTNLGSIYLERLEISL